MTVWTALWIGLAVSVPTEQGPAFKEVTDRLGVDFVHDAGAAGGYALPEIMGGGVALLDYDNDGDLDLYFVQSGPLTPGDGATRPPNRLLRQEPSGRFVDVTDRSGLGDTGYGTGVAIGDYDNDGRVDVFVGNFGPDSLYRNRGNGSFENVSATSGLVESGWSSSAAFCDYDSDGYLDLYVAQYVSGDPEKKCVRADGAPDYCSPQSYRYDRDVLYRNRGDGTFEDVTASSGIGSLRAPGLGVLCADLTGDGLVDFYVANDGEANQLWENRRDGTFSDVAILMGAALNGFGRAEASMGVAAGDVDGDGDLDLFMTHLDNESNTLYLNDGDLGFEDVSAARAVGAPSIEQTGFGTAFFDYDHDGDLDIIGVNGRVAWAAPLPGAALDSYWSPFAEPNFLLENDGTGRFADRTAATGPFGATIEVSRGLALGDLDSDGDLDVVVTNTGGRARVYENVSDKAGRWLMVRALEGERDSHGAVVTILVGEARYVHVANPGYSYYSSNDPRAHFGVPDADRVDSIVVRWPDGSEEAFPGGALDRVVVVTKGAGEDDSP